MLTETRPELSALHAKLKAFVRDVVEPGERTYRQQHAASANRWSVPPVIDELKAQAKAAGLWNLWLPESEFGAGLTNREYAPLCETMGRSHLAPEVFNCSAPDTGNMEVLVRYGTEEQKAAAASRRRDPFRVCDDRARRRLVGRNQHRGAHRARR
jgi:acyl-CoA dehydrogenase